MEVALASLHHFSSDPVFLSVFIVLGARKLFQPSGLAFSSIAMTAALAAACAQLAALPQLDALLRRPPTDRPEAPRSASEAEGDLSDSISFFVALEDLGRRWLQR